MLSDRWRVLKKHTDSKVDVQLLVNMLFYDLCLFLIATIFEVFRFVLQWYKNYRPYF